MVEAKEEDEVDEVAAAEGRKDSKLVRLFLTTGIMPPVGGVSVVMTEDEDEGEGDGAVRGALGTEQEDDTSSSFRSVDWSLLLLLLEANEEEDDKGLLFKS